MMKSLSKHEPNCNGLILKVIQDVLIEIFGKKSFHNIVRTMKNRYSLEWKEVPERSDIFSGALRDILGLGSMIIEDLIIEKLYLDLGAEPILKKDFSFSDYITKLPSVCKTVSQQ